MPAYGVVVPNHLPTYLVYLTARLTALIRVGLRNRIEPAETCGERWGPFRVPVTKRRRNPSYKGAFITRTDREAFLVALATNFLGRLTYGSPYSCHSYSSYSFSVGPTLMISEPRPSSTGTYSLRVATRSRDRIPEGVCVVFWDPVTGM